MYQATSVFPNAGDVSASIFDNRDRRIRAIRLGDNITIHIKDRATLKALGAALDAIYADMNAAEQNATEQDARDQVPTEMADWPPAKAAVWTCSVSGPVAHADIPPGGDLPMRQAVRAAYLAVTGQEETHLSSGWGGGRQEMADWPAGPPGELSEVFGK